MKIISKENRSILVVSIIGVLIVFLLWSLSAIIITKYFSIPSERGLFGDMFGAVNALFSGLAFLGLIIALFLQKRELEEQRKEIRESMEAQKKSIETMKEQAEISLLQTKLEALNHIINGYERRITRAEKSQLILEHIKKDDLIKERDKYEEKLKLLINEILK